MTSTAPNLDQMNVDRRLARRRMAWWSFLSLFADMAIIFGGLLFGPPSFGTSLAAVSIPVGTIIGARVTIILGYLTGSAYEAVRTPQNSP